MPGTERGASLAASRLRRVLRACIDYRRDGQWALNTRELAFRLIGRFSPSVAVERDGAIYFVSTADHQVGRTTFVHGGFEQEIMGSILEIIKCHFNVPDFLVGRTFVDVGANIGTSTIPALRTFGAARAIAIEPAPSNILLLRCNLLANGLADRVQVVEAAASACSGVASLELSGDNFGDHRIRLPVNGQEEAFAESDRLTIPVPMMTLDDLIGAGQGGWTDVGLVWMDAQGHEGHILAGASSLVATDIPVVVEYWPYGLRRAGGLDLFHDLVSSNYEAAIDVRASMRSRTKVVVQAPALKALQEDYLQTDFTDLILLKSRRSGDLR